MELIPIREKIEENEALGTVPFVRDIIFQTTEFYKKVGFVPPWIGYFVKKDNRLVGSAGFKGPPRNNTVEIAYGTFEEYRNQGIGTGMCRLLVSISMNNDASIKITARTDQPNNFSTKILQKNNFKCMGIVTDPEDGEVWEWVFQKNDHTENE